MHQRFRLLLTIAAWCAQAAFAQPAMDAALKDLKFREIGPAIMGGRIDDFAVVESNPNIIFAGTASGGVWKSINGGTTWEPVFDNQSVSTIGDITLAPNDPSIVWVGSGEANNRQSSSWGDGVYRSMDGGKSWSHMGLKETRHIGRLAIHPVDPNIVYVAAVGHLWGPNPERGVYKTTDGGKTWTQSLFVDADTGVVDLAMDPQSPNTLYAAAYQRRRTVFGFNGGGPRSGIYKTTDGGAHWSKLTKGLPETGDVGRIGLDIYRRDPNIVYALVEHAQGGIYRSDNKGETWVKMSATNPRPSYYSQVRIDPNNDQRIWVMGAPMYYSEDGGKTFRTNQVTRIHSDFHALWIDPANSDHMLTGSDGGIHISFDRGRSWDFVNTIPLGQFYEVGFDMRKPYHVCGGLQDNNSWCGPSATWFTRGISNDEWIAVGGGDGFYAQIDPTDPDTVYAESQDGNLLRRNLRTNEARSLRPLELDDQAPRYRFQWNSPIVISPHDHKTIYYGGNFLFRSADRGDTWTKISPDLTTGLERDKLAILGKVPDKDTLSRHDGVQQFPCITTISESSLRAGLIWVGTDDGNLQVTRDGGKTWTNVTSKVPGVPKGTYVSRVVASRHSEGAAYVTFDGHRGDDYGVYMFRTAEYGDTWSPITKGIPPEAGSLNVVREHFRNPNLLFAGAEFGLYVSLDRGANWRKLKSNLPTVPVDDIAIHPRENDLILGTHGRSIWILDDLTPLEQMSEKVLASEVHVFDVRPATAWRMYNHKGNSGHQIFLGQNPPYGALISYYLKGKADKLTIEILDKEGKLIRRLQGLNEPGVHRVNWDLRYERPSEPTREQQEAVQLGFGFGPRGPMVDPGQFSVRISAGGQQISKAVAVEEDPRVTMTAEDRARRRQALTQIYDMQKQADQGRRKITGIKTALTAAIESWKAPGTLVIPDNIRKSADALLAKVNTVSASFVDAERPMGSAGPPLQYRPSPVPSRLGRLMSAIEGYSAAPTGQQVQEVSLVSKLLADAMTGIKKLEDEDLKGLNRAMNEAGVPLITPAPVAPPAGRRRPR